MSDPCRPATGEPSNFNLPNALTTLRIVLVPFLGVALLMDGGDSIAWRMIAFVIFVVAMITDKIDGDIARTRGLITDFGKIADPIADKAMTGMAFVGLAIIFDSPWWWAVTIVVLIREWSVTLLRLSILKRMVIAADTPRQAQDHLPGDRAQRTDPAAARPRPAGLDGDPGRGPLLRLAGPARRRRGAHARLRRAVLPGRLEPAAPAQKDCANLIQWPRTMIRARRDLPVDPLGWRT